MLRVYLILSTLLLLNFHEIKAQTFSIGPVAGLNMSKISNIPNAKLLPGLAIGAFVNYSVHENFGLSSKLLFSQLGTAIENSERTYSLNYIQVPISGVYYFGSTGDRIRPKVFAGPYLGYLISAKDNNGNKIITPQGEDSYNKLDFGGHIGLGFNYLLKSRTWLNLDAAYSGSLIDFSNDSSTVAKNTTLGVNLGISFPL
jgi:outer membrane protein W